MKPRGAALLILLLACACGRPPAGKPAPTLEAAERRAGMAIAPDSPPDVPIEAAAAGESVAEAAGTARLGPIEIRLLDVGRRDRGVGRFWPSSDFALYAVRLRLSNPSADTAPEAQTVEIVPSTTFLLVDAAGAPHALSAAAAALDPSPFRPVRLAPGDSAERLLLFPVPAGIPAARLEAYLGVETAAFALPPDIRPRSSASAPAETSTASPAPAEPARAGIMPEVVSVPDLSIGRARSDAGRLDLIEYVPGGRAWRVVARLETLADAEIGETTIALVDGDRRLLPERHDLPARLPAGAVVVFEAHFPPPESPIPRLEVDLAGGAPLRIALPVAASSP